MSSLVAEVDRGLDAHDSRINAMLAARARRNGHQGEIPDTRKTPLAELMTAELGETSDEMAIRLETFNRWIDFCGQDGPHPADVLKNFYAIVHALRPEAFGALFTGMTCADYALLFGETRAAHSWRVRKIYTRFVMKRGARAGKAGFQKREGASANYSRAQRGNRNRTGNKFGTQEIRKSNNKKAA